MENTYLLNFGYSPKSCEWDNILGFILIFIEFIDF